MVPIQSLIGLPDNTTACTWFRCPRMAGSPSGIICSPQFSYQRGLQQHRPSKMPSQSDNACGLTGARRHSEPRSSLSIQ